MRKFRIITAAAMAIACGTSELSAQFSALFNRAKHETVVMQGPIEPNSSCSMIGGRNKTAVYGHYSVSWRRWPEPIGAYTTNPQLTPFVVPDRSGAPLIDVPDVLDETAINPKNRARDEANAGSADSEAATDSAAPDVTPADSPSLDGTDDLVPEIPDTETDTNLDAAFPPSESDLSLPDDSSDMDDAFGPSTSPDTGTPSDSGGETDGGFDDIFGGDDSLDFGNSEPRRFNRRNGRESEPSFDRRPEREARRTSRGPDLIEPTGASVVADVDGDNPLRRRELDDQPASVAHAVHYGEQEMSREETEYRRRLAEARRYRDRRYPPRRREYLEPSRDRYVDDFEYEYDPRYDARQYDGRQVDYRAVPDRMDDFRFESRRDESEYDYRYDRERSAPPRRATDNPSKSSNPLRP
ncbi:MAG: hypothetical protein KDB27_00825 [Planctomycetales bacterium]|nr:hypothetical protein [Planctomycetales bacterium]